MKMKLYSATILGIIISLGISAQVVKPKPTKKYFDPSNMDSTVKPGDDFYQYANGKWIKKTVIPETESRVGSFTDVFNVTKNNLKTIFTDLPKTKWEKGTIEQKVSDYYASGMDSVTIDKLGYEPIKPFLKEIDALKDVKGVLAFIAEKQNLNIGFLYGVGIGPDDKNSAVNIVGFGQSGLGLPDRDYYFKKDAANAAVVKAYKTYLETLFKLIGTEQELATNYAETIYNFESKLAESHRTRVEMRDPQINYNKLAVADLDKQQPNFGWVTALKTMRMPVDSVNVGQPAFFTKVNELLKSTPLNVWKIYLKGHLLTFAANKLSKDFSDAQFAYAGKALSGQQKQKPRWERMIQSTDANLSEALGQLYVKKYFTPEAKKRMLVLVNNLGKAFEARINKLDWMSDSTKTTAKEKLHTFIKKIGYPDKWRDYSKVTINKSSYFENVLSVYKNEVEHELSKLNKPVDKTEWGMSPSTVNAYYNPSFNEIVFPGGILQFPFFDLNADDAINYGGIGVVIGHEMTHGFDDQGAQYDKDGNLVNWWRPADEEKFKVKTEQVINQYNQFTVLDTLHVNGALTTGENLADMGGVSIAYDAFKLTAQGKSNTKIDGFTPDQRFFLSFANIWRSKQKEQSIRQRINTDPHSPAQWRVIGPLMNFTPFYTAFNVKEGDKMYKKEADRIKVW